MYIGGIMKFGGGGIMFGGIMLGGIIGGIAGIMFMLPGVGGTIPGCGPPACVCDIGAPGAVGG